MQWDELTFPLIMAITKRGCKFLSGKLSFILDVITIRSQTWLICNFIALHGPLPEEFNGPWMVKPGE